jgi:glycerol-3-phosphate acyltransferase PlsY
VSLASLALGAALPLVALWRASEGRYGLEVVAFCAALFALILVRHGSNLRRIRAGTESKVGRRRTEVETG